MFENKIQIGEIMKEIKVSGMSCSHCEASVKRALSENGANEVLVDLDKGIVQFDCELSEAQVKELLEDLGFGLVEYANEASHKILKPM